jgi:digalactosyldiacylglycerol synthase
MEMVRIHRVRLLLGSSEDSQAVQAAARKLDLGINFFKGKDHAQDSLHG